MAGAYVLTMFIGFSLRPNVWTVVNASKLWRGREWIFDDNENARVSAGS